MLGLRPLQTVLPTPQSNQTLKPTFFAKTGAGTETAYTPTAGKTFYLMEVMCFTQGANETLNLLDVDGTTTIALFFNNTSSAQNYLAPSGCPIQAYTNANPVKFSGGSNASKITLIGWEE